MVVLDAPAIGVGVQDPDASRNPAFKASTSLARSASTKDRSYSRAAKLQAHLYLPAHSGGNTDFVLRGTTPGRFAENLASRNGSR